MFLCFLMFYISLIASCLLIASFFHFRVSSFPCFLLLLSSFSARLSVLLCASSASLSARLLPLISFCIYSLFFLSPSLSYFCFSLRYIEIHAFNNLNISIASIALINSSGLPRFWSCSQEHFALLWKVNLISL